MLVFLQLNSPLGSGVGPNFNLTANVGVVVPSTATAAQLLAGIIVNVSNSANTITITPSGATDCPTPIVVNISPASTTTSTSTTTTLTPLCQCTTIQNPSTTLEAHILYRNCNGQLAGYTVYPLQSVQLCGTNFVSDREDTNITVGGPCITAVTPPVCSLPTTTSTSTTSTTTIAPTPLCLNGELTCDNIISGFQHFLNKVQIYNGISNAITFNFLQPASGGGGYVGPSCCIECPTECSTTYNDQDVPPQSISYSYYVLGSASTVNNFLSAVFDQPISPFIRGEDTLNCCLNMGFDFLETATYWCNNSTLNSMFRGGTCPSFTAGSDFVYGKTCTTNNNFETCLANLKTSLGVTNFTTLMGEGIVEYGSFPGSGTQLCNLLNALTSGSKSNLNAMQNLFGAGIAIVCNNNQIAIGGVENMIVYLSNIGAIYTEPPVIP